MNGRSLLMKCTLILIFKRGLTFAIYIWYKRKDNALGFHLPPISSNLSQYLSSNLIKREAEKVQIQDFEPRNW